MTLTVTHTPKCPERDREYQTGSLAFLSGFFAFSSLHNLRHKISHRLCRPILLLPGGVGIGAESEACVVVPQHTADRFHIGRRPDIKSTGMVFCSFRCLDIKKRHKLFSKSAAFAGAQNGRCFADTARFLCCCSLVCAAPFSAALKKH